MAEVKHLFNGATHDPAADGLADESHWQAIVEVVMQQAVAVVARKNFMRVNPPGERPGNLPITEASARLAIKMLRHPPAANRAKHRHRQHDAGVGKGSRL